MFPLIYSIDRRKNEIKLFCIIFKGLSLKQIKYFFGEGESPTLNQAGISKFFDFKPGIFINFN